MKIAAGCGNILVPEALHDFEKGCACMEHREGEGVPRRMNPGHAKIALKNIGQSSLRKRATKPFMREGEPDCLLRIELATSTLRRGALRIIVEHRFQVFQERPN